MGSEDSEVDHIDLRMAFASILLLLTSRFLQAETPLEYVFDSLIPRAAALSLFATVLLLIRAAAHALERSGCIRSRRMPAFGRKGILIAGSAVVFAASCLYRALNIADEGAYLCRGPRSIFNAPAAGRAVATIGELALVLQIKSYLEDTALRLGAARRYPSRSQRTCVSLALLAESCSWAGVLSGVAKCFSGPHAVPALPLHSVHSAHCGACAVCGAGAFAPSTSAGLALPSCGRGTRPSFYINRARMAMSSFTPPSLPLRLALLHSTSPTSCRTFLARLR